jgi:hypothetical protein
LIIIGLATLHRLKHGIIIITTIIIIISSSVGSTGSDRLSLLSNTNEHTQVSSAINTYHLFSSLIMICDYFHHSCSKHVPASGEAYLEAPSQLSGARQFLRTPPLFLDPPDFDRDATEAPSDLRIQGDDWGRS